MNFLKIKQTNKQASFFKTISIEIRALNTEKQKQAGGVGTRGGKKSARLKKNKLRTMKQEK